jgi:hypothetical protein
MAIPRATEIFEIRITVAENELPFWNCSRPAMNPDKNEDANQIELECECRDDLWFGLPPACVLQVIERQIQDLVGFSLA